MTPNDNLKTYSLKDMEYYKIYGRTDETQYPLPLFFNGSGIEIKTDTGKLLSGVVAELFDANGEFIDYKSSNDQGKITFENLDKEAKSVVISDVPKGYKFEQNYTLGGQNTEILLETQLINEGHQGVKYQLGSIMHDFTVCVTRYRIWKKTIRLMPTITTQTIYIILTEQAHIL